MNIMNDINDICHRVMLIDKGKAVLVEKPEKIRGELLEHERITISSHPQRIG
jgi:ABC-type multidrug transport system ATPase subunit